MNQLNIDRATTEIKMLDLLVLSMTFKRLIVDSFLVNLIIALDIYRGWKRVKGVNLNEWPIDLLLFGFE